MNRLLTSERFLTISLFVSCVFFVLFAYLLGASLNVTQANSQIYAAASFENHQYYTHCVLSGVQEETTYEEVNGMVYSLYKHNKKVNSYLKTEEEFLFSNNLSSFKTNICSVSAYTDKEEMEYLPIPLYSSESPIARGPKNGAMFASYLPSSLADELIESGSFDSFETIIDAQIIFSATINGIEYSFSVNNIYLNNASNNWLRESDLKNNKYFQHFSKWNNQAIISYCPSAIKNGSQCQFTFDVREGYDNLEFALKVVVSNMVVGKAQIELFSNKQNKSFFVTNISKSFFSDKLVSFSQFLFLSLMIVSSILVVLLWFFSFKAHLKQKLFIILGGSLTIALALTEFAKSIFKSIPMAYSIFNPVGNICIFTLVIVFFATSFFVRERGDFVEKIVFSEISI